MCRISKVDTDFIAKGFHIHINEIELAMRPDHLGGVFFVKVFARDSDRDVHPAIKIAEGLLLDPEWRARFREALRKARDYVLNERGKSRKKANGRAGEFNFMIVALERMEVE